MTIQFRIEHAKRELLATLVLQRMLRDEGLRSRIDPLCGIIRPGAAVVAVPWMYDDVDYRNQVPPGWSRPVFSMNWEQIYSRSTRGILVPCGDHVRDVDHLAWGPVSVGHLLDAGVSEERICRAGHPRRLLYLDRDLVPERSALAAQHGLDEGCKWVLVPMNFNGVFVSPQHVQNLVARGFVPDDGAGLIAAETRRRMLVLLRNLAAEFPRVQYVIRTHPGGYEPSTDYDAIAKEHPNVRVISSGDISAWVAVCDLLVAWTSTSAIDALWAGKDVMCYDPLGHAERVEYPICRMIPMATEDNHVMQAVDSSAPKLTSENWDEYRRWYGFTDDRTGVRIVEHLRRLAAQGAGRGLSNLLGLDFRDAGGWRSWSRHAYRTVKRLGGGEVASRFWHARLAEVVRDPVALMSITDAVG